MIKTYKINRNGIYKSLNLLRQHFYAIPIGILFIIPFMFYIKGKEWDFAITYGPRIAIASFLILGLLPTVLMHLLHYIANRNLTITINTELQTMSFQISGNEPVTYNFDNLKATQHLAIYHKNKVDGNLRISGAWSNYSFLKVRSNDNKAYFISSLIMDETNFPIPITNIKYSGWPSFRQIVIDTKSEDEKQRLQEHKRLVEVQSQLNVWKKNFANLTFEQIEIKLEESSKLAQLPKKALIELRNEKKLLTIAKKA